jgi:ATP-dependent Clp protease protease subunit
VDCIHLIGPITSETAAFFFPFFAEADGRKGKAPILVRLVTPGGDASVGLAIYDLIQGAKHPVIIEALGECSSIGMVILQAAKRRRVSKSLRALIHNGSVDVAEGHLGSQHLATAAKELKRLDAFLHRLLARHTGKSVQYIKKLCEAETVFTADELVANGFADDIINGKR